MIRLRQVALSALIAPLALGLAACGETATEAGGAIEGEPIAAIPAPEGQAWVDTVTVTDEGGYMMGNPDAPLKLVEYASHTCGACANFAATGATPLREDYVSTGRVSFEIRNLVRDPIDLTISALARCGQKESFHPLADQAWANLNQFFERAQQNPAAMEQIGQLPEDQRFVAVAEATGLIDFFAQRGLSSDQARTCLSDAETVTAIAERSQAQSEELGLTGTPTFLLNGQIVEANTWEQLEPILQRAGAR